MKSYLEDKKVLVSVNGKTIIGGPGDSIYISSHRTTYSNGSIVDVDPCAASVVFESVQALSIMEGVTFKNITGIDKISIGADLKCGPIKVSKITIELLRRGEVVFHLGLSLEEAGQDKIYNYLVGIENAIYNEIGLPARYNFSDDLVIDSRGESDVYDTISRTYALLSSRFEEFK